VLWGQQAGETRLEQQQDVGDHFIHRVAPGFEPGDDLPMGA
jgi:hypothetical protein